MSLAQQLADLDQTAPADFDPEDLNFADGTAPERDEDEQVPNSSGREHYLQVGTSSLRNKLQDIDDPKYAGSRVSRKVLDGSEEPEEPEMSVEGEEDDDDRSIHFSGDGESEGHEEFPTDAEDAGEERASKAHLQSKKVDQPPLNSRVDDLKKAKSVKRQGLLWNALVDARIRIQKAVIQANRLPSEALLTDLSSSPPTSQSLKRFLETSVQLSQDMSDLRRTLLSANEGLQPPAPKKRRLDAQADFEPAWTDMVAEATNERNTLESTLHPHLLQVLNKWSTRINAISSTALLSTRATSFRGRSNRIKGVAETLDDTLLDDKVLGRTRVLRNTLNRVSTKRPSNQHEISGDRGPDDSGEEGWEIFDDTDFYHQLLRDVVDARKEGNSLDPIPIRSQKVKKKVDTKASKGRKIRYTVHEKIQNFMVPIPRAGWHEEQIDEFFVSLLGGAEKKLEIDGVVPNGGLTNGDDVLTGDFKLFG